MGFTRISLDNVNSTKGVRDDSEMYVCLKVSSNALSLPDVGI
jgi:hypothetical protein